MLLRVVNKGDSGLVEFAHLGVCKVATHLLGPLGLSWVSRLHHFQSSTVTTVTTLDRDESLSGVVQALADVGNLCADRCLGRVVERDRTETLRVVELE